MKRSTFILTSIGLGLGLFAVQQLGGSEPPTSALAIAILLILNVLAGAALTTVLMLQNRLLSRYAGVKNLLETPKSPNIRANLVGLAGGIFCLLAIGFGIFAPKGYQWPAFATAIGPILTLLPLASMDWNARDMGLRALLGASIGTATGFGVLVVNQDTMAQFSTEQVLFCAIAAVLWTVAQAAGILARRLAQ